MMFPRPTRAWLTLLAAAFAPPAFADGPTGEQIYRQRCARCHGPDGQGTKKHKDPLAGDKSAAELTKVIDETMPEDDPGSLPKADAEKVAAYVHEAFYSPAARARNKPARVELSRLTVRQYRNAVADLVGSFRPPAQPDDRRGLHAEYYKSRRFRPGDRALERVDPEVNFDFGTESPDNDKLAAAEFTIRWEGSVLTPETGDYEFVVRTEHAARLWVNDPVRPLIDAWVKSGNDTEFRGTIFLLAGRAYHLRLEFSKAKQGVDDSKKMVGPPKPVPASVALLWKLPHRVPEVVPQRYLSPGRAPEAFAVATPFPPDDRSLGWERGNTVSKAWDQAVTDAAIETAGYVAAHLDELAGISAKAPRPGSGSGNPSEINLDGLVGPMLPAPDRVEKLRDFCRRFAERAYRRPLSDDQKRLIDHQFDAAKDADAAVKRVVLLVLLSPRFLYREVGGGPDGYDVASRLSFALWDSLPDDELLKAAADGKLASREQVARKAERMLADPRAKAKLREFLHVWLKVDNNPDLAKDPKRLPGFDPAVAADLRASLDLFLDDVLSPGRSDFRRLLLADDLYLNGRLAKFYGADLPADAPFTKVKLNPDYRAGVLTHPYLMAAFAYTGSTSPIHRGVFLARGVLGRSLRPPPEAFVPLPEGQHPDLSTRERVALQTRPQACQGCHGMINPLGFTLEHFDAVGRYREEDNGKPVDASGEYLTEAGAVVKLDGARQLGKFLADSPEVQAAFAEKLFHHLAQQPAQAYGPKTLADLRATFTRTGFDIRKLAVEVAVTAALTGCEKKPPTSEPRPSESGPRGPAP
jgi:cytochrome c553